MTALDEGAVPRERPATAHVLIVDDEPHLLRALSMNLSGRGYRVTSATTGIAALELAAAQQPDLLVLDLGLPDIDGLEVIRRLRQGTADMPIIVLSARSASQEKVSALDLGATDYVTKPFDMNELVARLRAAARRAPVGETDTVISLGSVTVGLPARIVRRDDADVHDGATRGDPEHTERSYLRIYMQQLRRKLEADPARPRYLITEPGLGYRYLP
jgi:two-component system KDP operon response regulator KdpE